MKKVMCDETNPGAGCSPGASLYPEGVGEMEKQFEYYVANQAALVAKYSGKWIVIAAERVVGDFDTEEAAYRFATSECTAGTYVIQRVLPGAESHSQTFHSRVAI